MDANMTKKIILTFSLLVLLSATVVAIDEQKALVFKGQDLHLAGKEVISHQLTTGEHCLVFQNGFSMAIGGNRFSSARAVVWLESKRVQYSGRERIDYLANVYMEGRVSIKKSKIAIPGMHISSRYFVPDNIFITNQGFTGHDILVAHCNFGPEK